MVVECEQSFELLGLTYPPWRTLPTLLSVFHSCFGQDRHHLAQAQLVSITNQELAVVRSRGGLDEVGTRLSRIHDKDLQEARRLRGALAKFHPSLWCREYPQEYFGCGKQKQDEDEEEPLKFEKVTYRVVGIYVLVTLCFFLIYGR